MLHIVPLHAHNTSIKLERDPLVYCFTRLWEGEAFKTRGDNGQWVIAIHFFIDTSGILFVLVLDIDHGWFLQSSASEFWFENSSNPWISDSVERTITEYN